MSSVTHASALGLRDAQEDRYAVVRIEEPAAEGWMLAVFDGHNGARAADTAAAAAPRILSDMLASSEGGEAAVRRTLAAVGELVGGEEAGSSASLAWVDERMGRAFIAVIGDSPVIVRDEDGLHLAPLHGVTTDPRGVEEAVARGALLLDGYLVDPRTLEGVNLTRSIGDAPFRFLGRHPDTQAFVLGDQSYVVVGSDGLFTPLAPTPELLIKRVAWLVEAGADARALVDDALACGSADNVTALLWRAG